jgi:hypothetical protein
VRGQPFRKSTLFKSGGVVPTGVTTLHDYGFYESNEELFLEETNKGAQSSGALAGFAALGLEQHLGAELDLARGGCSGSDHTRCR